MPTPATPAFRPLAAACLALAGLGGHATALSAETPEANWAAIAACASKSDERARHTCMDGVLRAAGVLTAETQAKDRRSRFGLDAPPPAQPQTPGQPAAEPVDERIEVKLATVTVTPDAKLIVTTTDGVVWRQRDSESIRPLPAAGDTMTIRKASLGSFLCTVRGNDAWRCSRSR